MLLVAARDGPRGPQRAVAVPQRAAREVLRRRGGEGDVAPLALLPPVELLDAVGGHAEVTQPRAHAQRHEVALHAGPSAPRWSARPGGRSGRARAPGPRSAAGRPAPPAVGWKRLGPTQVKGEARGPNTGSISHHLPRSLSRCDEWPSRMMWFDVLSSASSAARSSVRTGMGSTGTVPSFSPTGSASRCPSSSCGLAWDWAGSGTGSPRGELRRRGVARVALLRGRVHAAAGH